MSLKGEQTGYATSTAVRGTSGPPPAIPPRASRSDAAALRRPAGARRGQRRRGEPRPTHYPDLRRRPGATSEKTLEIVGKF